MVMFFSGYPSVRTVMLVGSDAQEALLFAHISVPLQTPQFLKKNHHNVASAPRPCSVAPPASLPLHRCARPHLVLLRAPRHAPSTLPIVEGEVGEACACAAGREGMHAVPGVYAGLLLSTSPWPELAGHRGLH
jgi:hypothetical protein